MTSTKTQDYFLRGVVPIVVASLLWSVAYFIRKRIAADLGPFTITFLEAFSGTLLTSLFYRVGPRTGLQAVKRGGWRAALMAVLSVTVANSAMVYGFRSIDLSVASILEKTQPIFTVILAALFLKEKLSILSIGFGLLGILGTIAVMPLVTQGNAGLALSWSTGFGILAVLGAAATWAGAGVLGRRLAVSNLGPVNMSFLRASLGALTALPICLIFEPFTKDIRTVWPAIALACVNGFIDSVVCYVLYYRGMKHVTAGVTSIIEVLTPVGAVLLGVFVLGEHLSLRQCLGAVTVLGAVTALVTYEMRTHAKSVAVLKT